MSNTEHAARSAADEIAARGSTALRDAKAGLDDAMESVSDKGQEALRSAREVRDTFDKRSARRCVRIPIPRSRSRA